MTLTKLLGTAISTRSTPVDVAGGQGVSGGVPRRSFLGVLAISAVLAPDARAAAPANPIRILAFGDSLTAGYGLEDGRQAFPYQLQRALQAKKYDVMILQGGVSGDTTSGGVSRLNWSLASKPDAVILELGANDGLRAVDPALTEKNLRTIVTRLQQAGLPVLLTGMLAPPNLGRDFGQRYKAAFERVAKETGVLFYPFFLEEVAAVPDLNQADGLHPTEEGVAIVVKNILPSVEKLIAQVKDKQKAK